MLPELRFSFSLRLVLSLCGLAALATAAAITLQERTLSAELERAAADRLENSTLAAARLLANHRGRTLDRHRAIARTPEFRANLETAHVPTLAQHAKELQRRGPKGSAVLFVNRSGGTVAASGDSTLIEQLQGRSFAPPECASGTGCTNVVGAGESFLVDAGPTIAIGTDVPLLIRGTFIGSLRTAETLDDALLEEWSSLCGAHVHVASADHAAARLEGVAADIGGQQLRVTASFEAERAALNQLRSTLLGAGALAIALALVIALPLARYLLRGVRAIGGAAHRIHSGDLSIRLTEERNDEIGDVARALNSMLDRIESTQTGLERSQRIGHLGGWSQTEGSSEVQVTRELLNILDLDPPGAMIDRSQILARVHADDLEELKTALLRCERDGGSFSLDHRVVLRNGAVRVVHSQGDRIKTATEPFRLECTVQDITERKRVEEQVRTLAYRDGLTGLGNRRQFADSLHRSIALSREHLCPLAVLFLDLDDFKVVNDTLGHRAGDELLLEIARRIEAVVTESGASKASPSVHRLGGDEFAVILPQLVSGDAPLECATDILRRIEESIALDSGEVDISASIGIARWPDEGIDSEALLRGGDTAMYEAKREGRGQYRVYDASMRDALERRVNIDAGLRRATEEGRLEIAYQPKVELHSGRICGFEALLRWNSPELGPVPPGEFIEVAERTGQILALGEWALREAASQARRWHDEGIACGPVSVNVSSAQIDAGVLVDTVKSVLEETGLEPELLELEVTESCLVGDERQAIAAFKALKAIGVGLALDDFGTGYSSLSYLRRLPLDWVKIDQSFVQNIEADSRDHDLVSAIISMSGVLGLRVVAEGVETEHQRDLLEEMGCEVVQGFWYSPPLSVEDVPAVVSAWKARKKRASARGSSGKKPTSRQ